MYDTSTTSVFGEERRPASLQLSVYRPLNTNNEVLWTVAYATRTRGDITSSAVAKKGLGIADFAFTVYPTFENVGRFLPSTHCVKEPSNLGLAQVCHRERVARGVRLVPLCSAVVGRVRVSSRRVLGGTLIVPFLCCQEPAVVPILCEHCIVLPFSKRLYSVIRGRFWQIYPFRLVFVCW